MRLFLCFLLAACGDDAALPDSGRNDGGSAARDAGADAGSMSGLDGGATSTDGGLDAAVPPGALTYLEDVHPMFERAGCATFACHGSVFGGSGILLYMPDPESAYRDMIDRVSVRRPEAIVRRFEPAASVLVEHAETTLTEFAILTTEDAALVRRWVADGAFYSRGTSTDGGTPDGGTIDGGVIGPSSCTLADGRGLPPLPSACLPRCTASTWSAIVACRDAPDPTACQDAAIAMDPTAPIDLMGGADLIPLACDDCLSWQTTSCIEDSCRFPLLEFTRCANLRPGDPCTTERSTVQSCISLAPEVATCQRLRDRACAE